ncbi:uncharacterized protein VTP21DRAFT_4904, partial [Calcarisporiella thermophila]|uniref:uncharacterized protein n=1 Tax=Calcarisporiella thermophila TaxID=911321 RepID=UPI003742C773
AEAFAAPEEAWGAEETADWSAEGSAAPGAIDPRVAALASGYGGDWSADAHPQGESQWDV